MSACLHANLRKTPEGYRCAACGLVVVAAKAAPVALPAEDVAGDAGTGAAGAGMAAASAPAGAPVAIATPPAPSILGVPRAGLVVTAAGAPIAWLVVMVVPFASFIFSMLSTLCHEMGHAAAALVTGRPALPAFDFSFGGGVTMAGERRWWLLAAYLVAVVVLWRGWVEQPRLRWALGAATLAVAALIATGLDEAFFIVGGHVGQLLAAGVFLYRALTGVAVIQPGERWLYGVVGWALLGQSLGLSWGLIGDADFQAWYLQGKRGMDNDLVRAGEFFGLGLGTVAWLHLLAALAVPFAAAWAARVTGEDGER